MNLLEKFEKEKESKTYRRIDSLHKLDWYVGYNELEEMSLVLVVKGNFYKFTSTKFIKVNLVERVDNKFSLSFNLCDDSLVSIFLKFCEDMIEYTRNVKLNDNILQIVMLRWNMWKSAFKNIYNKHLTENEIRGLIGELIFLRDYMIPKYGVEKSIVAWQGPLQYHKDFEINDEWYEIKAIKDNAFIVKINSLQQLENENNKYGELDTVILKNTNKENNNFITINKVIKSLQEKIDSIEIEKIFFDKLSAIGYVYDEEYEKYIYEVKKIVRYNAVDKNFPKIRFEELKEGISNVSYDIILDKIQKFIIK